ncbi:1,2-phenylacetyl-CoA epoxidase subunit PaaE [Janibacter sp. G1551]|uniref:1,2-phenylacetyl-CoA epoxidase subunit PaaE n=1 Tax=Janibacter sp. G1551 TaxID=3420440 RepID=UPI003CFC7FC4
MSLLVPSTGTRRPTFHSLEVVDVERLTDAAVAITFAVPDDLAGQYLRFEAGQHVTLRADLGHGEVRQSYSIAMSPTRARETATLRVGSAHVPGGRMSTWLNTVVAVGDRIDVMTPTGGFHSPVRPRESRRHVAIAAGSGITPVLAIVTDILEREPLSAVTLLYGNRATRSIMFLEDLEDLKDAHPERFQLVHVLSREPRESELLSGRLDPNRISALLAAFAPVADVDEFYLCGPQGMVEGAQSLLAMAGVATDRVHHEVFHVASQEGRAAQVVIDEGAPAEAVVTVRLDGRRTRIEMPTRAESILDATLRQRPDAPYSCTGGVCGTCRARVVSGEVSMDRNYALEVDEIARGIVLACQAHPVSDEVELDYDE